MLEARTKVPVVDAIEFSLKKLYSSDEAPEIQRSAMESF